MRKRIHADIPLCAGEWAYGNSYNYGVVEMSCNINQLNTVIVSKGVKTKRTVIRPKQLHENGQISALNEIHLELMSMLEKRYRKDLSHLSIEISSKVPENKGFGTQCADIIGICLGVAQVFEEPIEAYEIYEIVTNLTEAKGNIFGGTVLMDIHVPNKIASMKEELPYTLLSLVPEQSFESASEDLSSPNDIDDKMIERLIQALEEKDLNSLMSISFDSAIDSQGINKTPYLSDMLSVAKEYKAAGLLVARLGTISTLVFDRYEANLHERIKLAQKQIEDITGQKTLLSKPSHQKYKFYEETIPEEDE